MSLMVFQDRLAAKRLINEHLSQSRLEGARAAAQAALAQWPQDPEILTYCARVALREGDWPVALERARLAVSRAPGHIWAHRALVEAHLATGDVSAAEETAGEVGRRWPQGPDFPLLLTRIAMQREDWNEAVERARQVCAGWADNENGWKLLIGALLGAQQPSEAEEAALQAMKRWPQNRHFATEFTGLAAQRGDWTAVAAGLLPLVNTPGGPFWAWHLLIESLLRSSDRAVGWTVSVREAEHLLHSLPSDPDAHALLIGALNDAGRLTDAQVLGADAHSRWPDNLAIAAETQLGARLQLASELLGRAGAIHPSNPKLGLLHAQLAQRIDQLDTARQHLQRALPTDAPFATGRLLDIEIAIKEGDRTAALHKIAAAARWKAVDRQALIKHLASACRGQPRLGLQILKRLVLRGFPSGQRAVLLACYLFDTGRYVAARTTLLHGAPVLDDLGLLRLRNWLEFRLALCFGDDAFVLNKLNLDDVAGHFPDRYILNVSFIAAQFDRLASARALMDDIDKARGHVRSFNRRVIRCILAYYNGDLPAAGKLFRDAVMEHHLDARLLGLWYYLSQPQARLSMAGDPVIDARIVQARQMARKRLDAVGLMTHQVRTDLSRRYGGFDDRTVSYICPIHRQGDVANLCNQVFSQVHPAREFIFGINNSPAAEEIERRIRDQAEQSGIDAENLHILNLGLDIPLARTLNECVDRAAGEIVIKIDSDDIYYPGYTRKLVAYHALPDTEVVTQPEYFLYFEDDRHLALSVWRDRPEFGSITEKYGSGSAMSFKKRIWHRARFEEGLKRAEDNSFFERCLAMGIPIVASDPFDHVAVQRDRTQHTWFRPALMMLTREDLYFADELDVGVADFDRWSAGRETLASGLPQASLHGA